MSDARVVFLTALNLEYLAVRRHLTDLRVHWHPAGTRFEVGRIDGSDSPMALGLVGKGNHPAAVLAERAIAEFSPAALIFVGVAGALWPTTPLGDVVVASRVHAYHGGTSEDDGMKARPLSWEIAHRAGQVAQHVIRAGDWCRGLAADAAPAAHFSPIAAGEVVQNSAISDHARWVRQHYNDAMAIEMEAAGVAQAGHLNRALPVVVVRGISDLADGTKHVTDGKRWQPRAAAHAAAFATALAAELLAGGADDREPMTGKGGFERMSTTNNTATGGAWVGVQAGQIHGNVTVGVEPPERPTDLPAALAELRELLQRAHRAGRLDDETFRAADAELSTAAACLAAEGPRGRSGIVLALKRLGGLVADVAELAARLAVVIAAAKGLS